MDSDTESAKNAMSEYTLKFVAEVKKRFPDVEIYLPRFRKANENGIQTMEYASVNGPEDVSDMGYERFWRDSIRFCMVGATDCYDNIRHTDCDSPYVIIITGRNSEIPIPVERYESEFMESARKIPVFLFEDSSCGIKAAFGTDPADVLDNLDEEWENVTEELVGLPGVIVCPDRPRDYWVGNVILIPGEGCVAGGKDSDVFASLVRNLHILHSSKYLTAYLPLLVENGEMKEFRYRKVDSSNLNMVIKSLNLMNEPPIKELIDFLNELESESHLLKTAAVAVTHDGKPVCVGKSDFDVLMESRTIIDANKILVASEDIRFSESGKKVMHRITSESGDDVIFRKKGNRKS